MIKGFFSFLFLIIISYPFISQGENVTAFDVWQKGRAALEDSSYQKAEKLLKQALNRMPDNANLQVDYYRVLYTLAKDMDAYWYAELTAHYHNMHTVAKSVVTPPKFLEYVELLEKGTVKEQLVSLQAVIQQQPESSVAWLNLSYILEEEKMFYAALQAALVAHKHGKSSPRVLFQVGTLYDELAKQECRYEQKGYSQQAATYIAKGLSLYPQSPYYWDTLADLYARMGIFPLALQAANQAATLTSYRFFEEFFDVYLAQGKFDKILEVYDRVPEGLWKVTGFVYSGLALAHLAQNKWRMSYNFYQKVLRKDTDRDARNIYFGQWLYAIFAHKEPKLAKILKPKKTVVPWANGSAKTDWDKKLKAFMEYDTADSDAFVNSAKNICEKTEAHFYTALRKWQVNELDESFYHLNQVVRYKAYGFSEYIWAKAILASEAFSQRE